MKRPAKATLGIPGPLPIYHPRTVLRGLNHVRTHGLRAALHKVVRRLNPDPPYSAWIAAYDTLRPRDRAAILAHITRLAGRPEFALLMRVGAARPQCLRDAIEAIVAQLYPNWRLCVAVDATVDADTRALIDAFVGREPRIATSIEGEMPPDLPSADFFAIVGAEDKLPPHALYRVAVEIDEHPDADILYCDGDAVDATGERRDPYFKPDWSPALFHSRNLLAPFAVYRAVLVCEAGGLGEAFGVAGDYDLALRIVARTAPDRIRHLPAILYHRRTPHRPDEVSYAAAAMQALRAHFAEANDPAEIIPGAVPATWRVKRPLPMPAPHVSLIVPTRDRVELLRPCIDGLLHRTRYPNLDIVIVDNETSDAATLAYFAELRAERRVRLLRVGGPFNFSAINNRAAAIAQGDLIGLVNNDIDVIEPGWLEEMVGQAAQPGVGGVGAKLYYSDDTIQHAGVVLGLGGIAGHVHRGAARDAAGYGGWLGTVHDVSCVTAACLLVWKRVFDEVGGFDEVNLPVAFNDVDLCLKIRQAGYRLVWTPYAELYHRESASRGSDLTPQQIARFEREKAYLAGRWGAALERDPFYNPNLTLDDESFRLAFPPRAGKPWRRSRRGYSAT